MDPVLLLKYHVDAFETEKMNLTLTCNAIVEHVLVRNGEKVSSRYLLDDSGLPNICVWLLPHRSARPDTRVPASSDTQCEPRRDEEEGEGTSGGVRGNREVLVLLENITKWFIDPNCDRAPSDASLNLEICADGSERGPHYRGERFVETIRDFHEHTRPQAWQKLRENVANSEPSMVLRLFLICCFKALMERVEEFGRLWLTLAQAAKRTRAARRGRRLAALAEEDIEAYFGKGDDAGLGSASGSQGSRAFSSAALEQLETALPGREYAASVAALETGIGTLERTVSEKCTSFVNQHYSAIAPYYHAAVMCADEPESQGYSMLFPPAPMANIVKSFAGDLAATDRYPALPEDELVQYAKSRRRQFRLLELLWVSLAERDLCAVLQRKVTLEGLHASNRSGSGEGVGDGESEEDKDGNSNCGGDEATNESVAPTRAGSGWRSPREDVANTQRPQPPPSPMAGPVAPPQSGGNWEDDWEGDWEVAAARGLDAAAAAAAAAGGDGVPHRKDDDSPHALLRTLRFGAVPEETAFAGAVAEAVRQVRQVRGAREGPRQGPVSAASPPSREQRFRMLQALVFPREILPERTRLNNIVQRVTPYTPMEEVAFIFECLDARLPCVNAYPSRQHGRDLADIVKAVPRCRERQTKRQFVGNDLTDAALRTGRPDESIITFLRTGRVLRLEFSSPMPMPAGIETGFVCDCCGLENLTQGYQACTYEDVRSDTSFYNACIGYDMCMPCAVYFYKTAYSRLARALYPLADPAVMASPSSASSSSTWRADVYKPFAYGSGGSRVVVWSLSVLPAPPSAAGEGDAGEQEEAGEELGVEMRMFVSVCPYAAQPVAWSITAAQQATMRDAFAIQDEEESPHYLHVTPARRAALPAPPFTWRCRCRVVACVAGKNRTAAASSGESGSYGMFASTDTCPVCLGLLASAKPTLRTLCNHWFHVECVEQLPTAGAKKGEAGTHNGAEDNYDYGYEDFLSPRGPTAAMTQATRGSTTTATRGAPHADSESEEEEDSAGPCCPMCRRQNFMPSMRMQDVLDRNTYEMTLRVPRSATRALARGAKGTAPHAEEMRVCDIALASLISSDGHFHNYTNVASCQQLSVTFPASFIRATAKGGPSSPAKPVLFAYEEEEHA